MTDQSQHEYREPFKFGLPDEWRAFEERHGQVVVESVTSAHDMCFDLIKAAQEKIDSEESTVVWLLAGSCHREFGEICLLEKME